MKIDRRVFLRSAALWPAALSAQQPVYIRDLRIALPNSAVSTRPAARKWRVLPYESELGPGHLLSAGQNTMAEEISIPLNRRGWHAISFGLRSHYGESRLLARLKSAKTFSLLTHHDMIGTRIERRDIEVKGGTSFSSGPRVDELFWQVADLASEEIVLRQLRVESVSCPIWLAYVKLILLADEEVRRMHEDRRNPSNRRLFAHNDAFGSHGWLAYTTEEEIRREIEPYRNTDFSRMYWEAGMGDRMYYPSKIGMMSSDEWIDDPFRIRDRHVAAFYRSSKQKGFDPFRVALDAAKDAGLEFHAAYRVAGFHFPVPEDEWNYKGVYDRHPEWRGVDRAGNPTPRLSYAHEGVRRYVLSLVDEICRYPVDGFCMLYNRRPPLLEYEAPLVAGFQQRFGRDPRRLDERDAEWLAYRAGVLTGFMREVRAAAHRAAGRPIAITAIVMGTEEENLYNAIDVRTWVAQGLVDTIIPYTSGRDLNSARDSFVNPRDAEPFLRMTKGTACQAAINLMPRQISPEDYRKRAHGLYELGAENLFFWDCYQRCDFSHSWSALRRLGHKEEIAAWVRSGAPKIAQPGTTLRKLGDWDFRYATPG